MKSHARAIGQKFRRRAKRTSTSSRLFRRIHRLLNLGKPHLAQINITQAAYLCRVGSIARCSFQPVNQTDHRSRVPARGRLRSNDDATVLADRHPVGVVVGEVLQVRSVTWVQLLRRACSWTVPNFRRSLDSIGSSGSFSSSNAR